MNRIDYIVKELHEGILDVPNNNLNTSIFSNEKMKTKVKSFILKGIQDWCDKRDIKIKNVHLVGSNAGYSYNSTSDIDIEVEVDLTNEQIRNIWKDLPNGKNLLNTDHPVEYYLRNDGKPKKERGPAYNILNDTWLRNTEKESPFKNYKAATEVSRFFVLGIDAAISEYEMDAVAYKKYKSYLESDKNNSKEIKQQMEQKLFEILADLDTIFIAKHIIKSLRNEAFEKKNGLQIKTEIISRDANSSINNIIYKYINDLDYMKKVDSILNERDEWEEERNNFLRR